MERNANWLFPLGLFLILAFTVSLFLTHGAVADGGQASVSININTADTVELSSLPGIGASKAAAIIDYRTEHGPFTSVDEITNVRGVGNNILEKIRDLLRLN